MKRLLQYRFFVRLLHWEFWNSRLVYAPLYPYWLWLSIRARSFFFLTAANPRIRNGGFIMERKQDVYRLLPPGSYPATICCAPGADAGELIQQMEREHISFPCIAKPDHGERGLGVKKIHNREELERYAANMPLDFLVQQYIDYPMEVGIFYYRFPGAAMGAVSGIVNKEPVAVTGDGSKTVAMLVKETPRYLLQWQAIAQLHPDKLDTVLQPGERLVLIPYGNHSRGSKFTDVSGRATPDLVNAIDNICRRVPGFYFGRLDVRFESWELLAAGQFSIIELNGSGSEPTHIYDPAHSLFFAWREIIRHWNLLYRISRENNRRGTAYLTLRSGRMELRSFRTIDALLSAQTW